MRSNGVRIWCAFLPGCTSKRFSLVYDEQVPLLAEMYRHMILCSASTAPAQETGNCEVGNPEKLLINRGTPSTVVLADATDSLGTPKRKRDSQPFLRIFTTPPGRISAPVCWIPRAKSDTIFLELHRHKALWVEGYTSYYVAPKSRAKTGECGSD